MKQYYLCFAILNAIAIGSLETTEAVLDRLTDEQQISFYRGYLLWQEYLQRPGMSYDLVQVIAGMQAAEDGVTISCDEEKLRGKIRKFQENLLAKQAEENLCDAEAFLANTAKEDASLELIPKKLYFKRIKNGNGSAVLPFSTPLLRYSLRTYNRWGTTGITSIDTPVPIALEDTIPGFALGVVGMQEGEIRELMIHPDLAYGTYGGKLDPNLLVIVNVEVIQANSQTPLPNGRGLEGN